MKMTIDEAIRYCEEMAEQNDLAAGTYKLLAENNHNIYERLTAETNSLHCAKCAAVNKQLAEWLIELKKAKRFIREIENKLYLGTSFYPTSFLKENEKLFDELTKGVEHFDD